MRLLAVLTELLLPLNIAASANAGVVNANFATVSSPCSHGNHEGSGHPEPSAQCAIACAVLAPSDVACVEPRVSLKPSPLVISVERDGDGVELEPVPPPPRTVGHNRLSFPTVLIGDKS